MLTYENIQDIYTLSPLQKGMYYHALYDKTSLAYFEQLSYRFVGNLSIDLVEKSLIHLFKRHDILRTVFNHEKADVPLQIVLKQVPLTFHVEDIRSIGGDAEKKAYLNAYKEADKQRSFDLRKDVLMRVAVFSLEDETYEFIWTHHHIIADGWCTELLVGEFFELYTSFLENRPAQLPRIRPYRVYIDWLEKQDKQAAETYWKRYLDQYEDAAQLPKTNPTPTQPYTRTVHQFVLGEPATLALETIARTHQVTLNVIFQAIWGLLLAKHTGRRDVVFGTVVSGRPPEIEGVESMLGLFVNTLPVRVQYTEQTHFHELISLLHQQFVESQQYAYASLAEIQAASNVKQHLIDHLFGFQNYKTAATTSSESVSQAVSAQAAPVSVDKIEAFEQTNYDFDVRVSPGKTIHVMFEYNAAAYHETIIRRYERDMLALVSQVVANSTCLVDSLHLSFLEEEQAQWWATYDSATIRTDYPRDTNVASLFAEMVKSFPQHTAVIEEGRSYTYWELDQQSNQIAHFLLSQGLTPEAIVAVYQRKSFRLIASILGVLKAGGAYLPIHTEHPSDRIKAMLTEAKVRIVLSESTFIGELNTLQWECADLQAFVCLDAEDVYAIPEPVSRLRDKELWEYVGTQADDDIAGGGWTNSYTGEKFSREEMDEYGENVIRKLTPYVHTSARVLEVGCASGITMFRIAPQVGLYYGTDLSQAIIDRNQLVCEEKGIHNIKLACLAAGDIQQLDETGFDIIVLNSVVQCFDGYNYLRNVITHLLDLLNPTGVLFLGDLMDHEQKDALIKSVQAYKQANPQAKTKVDFNQELFVSRKFLEDLRCEMPQITSVVHTSKIGSHANELTQFRFDTIVTVDKTNQTQPLAKQKYQYDRRTIEACSTAAVSVSIQPTQLSNLIYTSGSTGKPKGIQIEHRGLVRLVKNTNYMQVQPEDVWAQTVDVSFDPSTLEIFGALLNGAALCLIPKETLLNASALAQALTHHRVTMMVLITPVFHELATIRPTMFAGLHTLIIGGEALNAKPVNTVIAACPGLTIINAYGPTENTVISTTFAIQQVVEQIGIGRPIANSEAYILDASQQPQPLGLAGELCVAGDGLARGYLNEPVLTGEKFIPHPHKPGKRLYRTGDQARWLPNGDIQFLGRIDEQVKLRGYRIELTEIEKTVRSLAGVAEALVLVLGKETDKQLVAFVKPEHAVEESQLRQELALLLPPYMIPSRFRILANFPLTPTGKVDRKSLQDQFYSEADGLAGAGVAPRTETEATLVAIWQEVLATTHVGVTDNFFELGGHSLKAMQVVSRIAKACKVTIELKDFFANPTIEGLAGVLANPGTQGYRPIVPVLPQAHYAISHAQRRLWILHTYEENSTAYNISGAYRFTGLNRDVFEQTMYTLVERHESLRTTFIVVDGEPQQRIQDRTVLGIQVEYLDLRADTQAEASAQGLANEAMQIPFNLETGPLIRMKLLHLTEDVYVFIFTMHHIISDGWSMRLLLEEVSLVYDAYSQGRPNPLPPLRVQYKDFVAYQHQVIREKDEQYWLRKLSGDLNWINLPADFPATDFHTFRGAFEQLTLDRETKESLQELATSYNTSLSNVVFTIFNILLYNISGQDDLVVGVAIANRTHPDVEKMVGFFVNTLVIRTQLSEDAEFSDTLKQISTTLVEAFDHQNYPFDLLVEKMNPDRITNKQPIFNVLYGYQNFADVAIDTGASPDEGTPSQETKQELTIEAFKQEFNSSKFDLTLFVNTWDDQINLSFEYNSELFKPTTIQKWLSYFEKFVSLILTESVSQ